MKIGVQVGQVVARGYDLRRQWLEQLEQFRASRDSGFDFVSWGHHWLIDPFQHFQPIPVLARFAAEAGAMDLVTGVLLTPLLKPVQVAEDVATLDHICRGGSSSASGWVIAPRSSRRRDRRCPSAFRGSRRGST